jgi:4-aminobutyrate aminotransferase/(S)-3-amino-2-methylpropionate transaminase
MDELPEIRTEVPGPRSRALAERLARVECPEVTCLTQPLIFWERASGSNVIDVDGNRYVDLLAGFGVACLGYAHPELARVAAVQAATLPHAMGDVYPARLKVELLEALARVLPDDLGAAILSSSGSDAVESALKTALVVTGRPGIVAFEGAYHGLGLGALDATHRDHFRAPFAARLPRNTRFVPYGDAEAVRQVIQREAIGAVLVEPIQGRGGIHVPPRGFLRELRSIADEAGALLIADEVYTGWGRTGAWLACQADPVVPDLVALGKALGGGFPISACAGRAELMHKWGPSTGEAVHTSTHLGNPLGCAMALKTLELLEHEHLLERARRLGAHLLQRLEREVRPCPGVRDVRGRGLLAGIELDAPERAARVVREALCSGWILLAEGADARVLSLTPPLTIPEPLLDGALDRLVELLSA